MPFEKGHKKIGGRKKGTRNRDTEFKRAIKEGISAEELLESVFSLEDPKDRVDRLLKLLQFAYPKMKAVEARDEHEVEQEPVQWNIVVHEPDGTVRPLNTRSQS